MIDVNVTYFNSSSEVNDTRCFVFSPVQDNVVEDAEQFNFQAVASNELDIFTEGYNAFALTIYDDDGIT